MSRVTWNAPEQRLFDVGLDRGMLYPKGQPRPPAEKYRNVYTRPSFETPGVLIEVERNLLRNPAGESAGGWIASGPNWTVSKDTTFKKVGSRSTRCVLNDVPGETRILSVDRIGVGPVGEGGVVTAGTICSVSAWFMTPSEGYKCRIIPQFVHFSGHVIESEIIIPEFDMLPNQWTRAMTTNLTVPENAIFVYLKGEIFNPNGPAITGEYGFVDAAMATPAWGHGSYFDGSTPNGDDFQYSWGGTANDSYSLRRATAPASVGGGASSAIHSTEWSSEGDASVRIYSKYHTSDSAYIELGGNVEWDKTYIVKAKYRVREPLENPPILRATTSGNTPAYTVNQLGPSSQPGVHEIALKFKFPPQSPGGNRYVRFINNNANGASVWVDDILVTEISDLEEDVSYFSGSTPNTSKWEHEWAGTQDASQSIRREKFTKAVPWNGLINVEETGSDGAVSYYIDGRPYLHFPKPKEYKASLSAYTYPDEFNEIMGLVEAADGMYLDSQVGESFDLSYRTKVGNAVAGADFAYKIHLVYNATVSPQEISYETMSSSINPTTFSWEIQAVPIAIEGFRPTAHIVIDTRNMSASVIETLENWLYGSPDELPHMPTPQEVFDLLSYGGTIIVTDNGDGTFDVTGSYENVYMVGDGIFRVDNIDGVDHGNGTFTISTTIG